jgi:hypothetical protein
MGGRRKLVRGGDWDLEETKVRLSQDICGFCLQTTSYMLGKGKRIKLGK